MSEHGNEVNLNYIDTTAITDMASLFRPDSHGNTYYGLSAFNGDISEWNVSAVTNMNAMFANAIAFNKDISDWNVVAVQNMTDMFVGAAKFNQDISKWNVASVTSMLGMFADATAFNKDISGWDVSAVQNMTNMFNGATEFKQNLDAWGRKINNKVKASSWLNAYGMFKDSGLAASLPTWCESDKDCKINALSTLTY